MIKKSKKLNLTVFLVLALFSIQLIQASTPINDTEFHSDVTNYTILINETVWMDAFNVTGLGYIEFYNLSSNLTHTPIMYNPNLTYDSQINLMGNYSNALCYTLNYEICNGTSANISNNDGNLNVTIYINNNSYFLNEYNLTEGINRTGSPIMIYLENSSNDDTYNYINYYFTNNLTETVNITFYPIGKALGNFVNVRYNPNLTYYTTPNYTTSGDYLYSVQIEELEPANDSNYLQLVYSIPSGGSGGGSSSGTSSIIEEEEEEEPLDVTIQAGEEEDDRLFGEKYEEYKDKGKDWIEEELPREIFGIKISWRWWIFIGLCISIVLILFIIWIIIYIGSKK